MNKYNYGTAMLSGFEYLLENYPEVFVIGQGLWSPWYVGNTMTDLDKKFGVERILVFQFQQQINQSIRVSNFIVIPAHNFNHISNN